MLYEAKSLDSKILMFLIIDRVLFMYLGVHHTAMYVFTMRYFVPFMFSLRTVSKI